MQKSLIELNESSSTEENPINIVERIGHDIYFYNKVDSSTSLSLIKYLKILDNENKWQAIKAGLSTIDANKMPPIKLHINSEGGSMFDAIAIADTILTLTSNVNTIIEGECASAATLISIVGNLRQITKNSYILIHQISGGAYGKYTEVKDAVENLDLFSEKLKEMYFNYTKIPKKEFEKLLHRDLYLPAEIAKQYKFVDEII